MNENPFFASGKFTVGLTGGIGSGKSTVADLFAARGVGIIDTDQIAHQLTAPGGIAINAISQTFGSEFIDNHGALNRQRMRELVFNDANAKRALEKILHPLITQECLQAALHSDGIYLMFVVPLLVESGIWKQRVARVLVVDCPERLQIQRVMQRSNLSEAQVQAIMATQVTREARLAAADNVIVNDNEIDMLEAQVERLHQYYIGLIQ